MNEKAVKNERLSFDESYDAAHRENIDMIHEQAIAENELFDLTPGKEY